MRVAYATLILFRKDKAMASYTSYIQQGVQNLNQGYNYNLQQIIAALGGLKNPTEDKYVQAEYRDITDPQLRTIAEYLSQLGAEGYQYKYEDILKGLQDATTAAYDARFNTLADATANYYRNMATQQESVADTIRSQYAQAIQNGVSRGMQSANVLSSILGTTQAAAADAQQLAQDKYQTGMDLQAQMVKDAADALSKSNAAYETLMGNIRQLYNDEIQEKTADLEYNASIAETNANYLAALYNANTNYATGVLGNASGIYNNNQSVLANLISAAAAAAAQDNYSANYLQAAQVAANAATQSSANAQSLAAAQAAAQKAAQEAAARQAEAQKAAQTQAAQQAAYAAAQKIAAATSSVVNSFTSAATPNTSNNGYTPTPKQNGSGGGTKKVMMTR